MPLLKVKDNSSLCRDTSSGAIVNTDENAYREYKAKKEKILAERAAVQAQKDEINNIKKDVNEIKELIKLVLKKIGE